MRLPVKELQKVLNDCDPNTEIEFLFHESIDDIPKHPAFILQYCRYAYYKTNRNPPLLVINFREHPTRKLQPTPDKENDTK